MVESAVWVAGTQELGLSTATFVGTLTGGWIRDTKEPGLEPGALIDVGIPNCSLKCCTTKTTPEIFILFIFSPLKF